MTKEVQTSIAFDESFIQYFLEPTDFAAVIESLSKNLLAKKLVTSGYANAVQAREKKFSTGLPTEPIGVAIPHTDPEYVNENAISVAILKQPILMRVMASGDQFVDVSVIFLLALGESNKQLNVLQKLMGIVQDQQVLSELTTMSKKEMVRTIKQAILEG
ncbi:PTS sugar transporter subunit IIA [Bombilactobacillus folatiphilus]|uniref:PTS sugar transporter subunit IIA n=1 Tax=Bombilactobacillus folatiphilus TaxID=2923362 RepID=A0ABY4P9H5_9LACO|nr:PTS sugar transporter subunit IIA [Bombilactobacillus folatiphilus]UQS82275.1 PTS sugar transporter subunit IIA [Bombilactobacillus folatiphilus]